MFADRAGHELVICPLWELGLKMPFGPPIPNTWL
jgi:hypothetical protein